MGVPHRTVKRWIARGRSERESKYGAFAAAIDAARRGTGAIDETDLSEAELEQIAWRAAQAGSVPAMRLCFEILRRQEAGEGRRRGPLHVPGRDCRTSAHAHRDGRLRWASCLRFSGRPATGVAGRPINRRSCYSTILKRRRLTLDFLPVASVACMLSR